MSENLIINKYSNLQVLRFVSTKSYPEDFQHAVNQAKYYIEAKIKASGDAKFTYADMDICEKVLIPASHDEAIAFSIYISIIAGELGVFESTGFVGFLEESAGNPIPEQRKLVYGYARYLEMHTSRAFMYAQIHEDNLTKLVRERAKYFLSEMNNYYKRAAEFFNNPNSVYKPVKKVSQQPKPAPAPKPEKIHFIDLEEEEIAMLKKISLERAVEIADDASQNDDFLDRYAGGLASLAEYEKDDSVAVEYCEKALIFDRKSKKHSRDILKIMDEKHGSNTEEDEKIIKEFTKTLTKGKYEPEQNKNVRFIGALGNMIIDIHDKINKVFPKLSKMKYICGVLSVIMFLGFAAFVLVSDPESIRWYSGFEATVIVFGLAAVGGLITGGIERVKRNCIWLLGFVAVIAFGGEFMGISASIEDPVPTLIGMIACTLATLDVIIGNSPSKIQKAKEEESKYFMGVRNEIEKTKACANALSEAVKACGSSVERDRMLRYYNIAENHLNELKKIAVMHL